MNIVKNLTKTLLLMISLSMLFISIASIQANAEIYDLTRRDNPPNSTNPNWYVVDLYSLGVYVATFSCVNTSDWKGLNHSQAITFVNNLNTSSWDNKTWLFSTSDAVLNYLWETFNNDPGYFFGVTGFDPTLTSGAIQEIWGWNSDATVPPDPEGFYSASLEWWTDTNDTFSYDNPSNGNNTNVNRSIWVYSLEGSPVPELPLMNIFLILGTLLGWGFIYQTVNVRKV
ncbi:membrane protein [Candidatus Omnitrophus magneticus]|uniref:Membrane protein n=1 Tax=Candidatus Omnitrophus magneticus TaxID=1609969 RepID=A0A0F0CMH2_9BACT|nr:membrane protein [Candidatus Omnitrophus magneticus]